VGLLGKAFNGGESGIISESSKIVKIAIEANSKLKALIEKPTVINEIKMLEKKSDDEVLRLSDMITSGSIAPNLIDDFLEYIDKEDSIVDSIYNLAREFLRYKPKNKRVRHYMRSQLLKMSDIGALAMSSLYKMQHNENLEIVKKHHVEIEHFEEEGDEIKDGIFDFAYSSINDFKTFYHVSQLAHYADNMLDNCEDASDVLVSIMDSIIS
jgi:uncharacterized protein Yka (UPF0111/DUF47 family)